jgi:hypothetical protein
MIERMKRGERVVVECMTLLDEYLLSDGEKIICLIH